MDGRTSISRKQDDYGSAAPIQDGGSLAGNDSAELSSTRSSASHAGTGARLRKTRVMAYKSIAAPVNTPMPFANFTRLLNPSLTPRLIKISTSSVPLTFTMMGTRDEPIGASPVLSQFTPGKSFEGCFNDLDCPFQCPYFLDELRVATRSLCMDLVDCK
jgi:hypothetical protein